MDTSKEYIKMSDCLEVKNWFNEHYPLAHLKKLGGYGKNKATDEHGNFWHLGKRKDLQLPRQDQIQEMIGDFSMVLPMLPRLERLDRKYSDIFTSMEQLWLAFYMYEKRGKTWDGKRWRPQ